VDVDRASLLASEIERDSTFRVLIPNSVEYSTIRNTRAGTTSMELNDPFAFGNRDLVIFFTFKLIGEDD